MLPPHLLTNPEHHEYKSQLTFCKGNKAVPNAHNPSGQADGTDHEQFKRLSSNGSSSAQTPLFIPVLSQQLKKPQHPAGAPLSEVFPVFGKPWKYLKSLVVQPLHFRASFKYSILK